MTKFLDALPQRSERTTDKDHEVLSIYKKMLEAQQANCHDATCTLETLLDQLAEVEAACETHHWVESLEDVDYIKDPDNLMVQFQSTSGAVNSCAEHGLFTSPMEVDFPSSPLASWRRQQTGICGAHEQQQNPWRDNKEFERAPSPEDFQRLQREVAILQREKKELLYQNKKLQEVASSTQRYLHEGQNDRPQSASALELRRQDSRLQSRPPSATYVVREDMALTKRSSAIIPELLEEQLERIKQQALADAVTRVRANSPTRCHSSPPQRPSTVGSTYRTLQNLYDSESSNIQSMSGLRLKQHSISHLCSNSPSSAASIGRTRRSPSNSPRIVRPRVDKSRYISPSAARNNTHKRLDGGIGFM